VAFPKDLLNTNEELVLDLRPHWLSLALPALYSFLAIVVAILLLVLGPDGSVGSVLNIVAAVLILGAIGFFGWKYLVWNSTMFVLTSDRIVSRRGVLSKSGIEIPLERINTVFFEQKVFERMIGAGDLTIESAGERGSETFEDVRKPAIVQKEIYVQMEANENRKFDRFAPVAGAAPAGPSGHDLAVQIEKLSELHQKGVLSDAEFSQKKQELLDRM
jgi:uncharacterized membrane protein YdbT with pleckstrin-like domain